MSRITSLYLRVSRTSSSPIWSPNWVPSIPSFKPKSKFTFNQNLLALQIRDLIDPNLTNWKSSSIHALFDSTSAQEILKIRISTDLGSNYIWTPSTSGWLSTSSAYRFILDYNSNDASLSNSSQFWKSIWKLNLNDRLKLFLWKIAWNILTTKECLGQLFNSISNSSCSLCKVADDSLNHLFFACIAWHQSFWSLDSTAFHFSYMSEWISSIISPGSSLGILLVDKHKFQIFAAVACDILWFYRNEAFHDGASFDARSMSVHINKISLEHFQVGTPLLKSWRKNGPLLHSTGLRSILILLFEILSQLRQWFVATIRAILFMQPHKLANSAPLMKGKLWLGLGIGHIGPVNRVTD